MTVGVITDATGDLPVALLEKYHLPSVPHLVVWGDETLVGGVDIDAKGFYRRLAQDPVYPHTAQPTAESFVEAFEATGADEVVAVVVSEKLSGAVTACNLARQMIDIPVHIVDTGTISLSLGMAAIAAAEARDAGADVQGIIAAARAVADKAHIFFTLDTMEYLHRGGRIGKATWLLGAALAIKPLLAVIDGSIEGVGRVRTRRRALDALVEMAIERINPDQPLRVGVMHGDAPDQAVEIVQRVREHFAPELLIEATVYPAIGVHAGPGVVGLAFYQP